MDFTYPRVNTFDKKTNGGYYSPMTKKELIQFFGNQSAAARALRCSRQLVSYWKHDAPVPWPWAAVAELASDGALKADEHESPAGSGSTAGTS